MLTLNNTILFFIFIFYYTFLTRQYSPISMSKSIIDRPLTISRSSTPKLYMSDFRVNRLLVAYPGARQPLSVSQETICSNKIHNGIQISKRKEKRKGNKCVLRQNSIASQFALIRKKKPTMCQQLHLQCPGHSCTNVSVVIWNQL